MEGPNRNGELHQETLKIQGAGKMEMGAQGSQEK